MTRISVIDKESKSFHPPSRKLFNYKDQVISKSIDHIHGRKKMDELPPIVKEIASKSKVVLFYKNGDRNFRGHHVTVTSRRFRNFDSLLSELTRVTNLPQGVRFIFTPVTGTRIESLEQLVDGQAYVCGSYPKFKRINYIHAPDGSSRKRVNDKSFIPAHVSNNKMKIEATEKQPANIKPKIITIVRNSVTRPKKSVKILLNKRTAQTYDQVLNDITGAVGVEGGCVRKLYNIDGKLVQSLTELFSDALVFIAVGNERFRTCDLPHIVEDLGIKGISSGVKINSVTSNNSLQNKPSKLKSSPKSSDHNINTSCEPSKPSIPALKKLPDIKSSSRNTLTPSNETNTSNRTTNGNLDDSIVHVNFEDSNIHSNIVDVEISDNVATKSREISLNQKVPLPSIKSSSSSSPSVNSDGNAELISTITSKSEDTSSYNEDKSSESHKDLKDVASESQTTSTNTENDHVEITHVDLDGNIQNEVKTTSKVENGEESKSTSNISSININPDQNMESKVISNSPREDKSNGNIQVNGYHKFSSSNISSTESSTGVSSTEVTISDTRKISDDEKSGLNKTMGFDNYIKKYINHQLSSSEDINMYFDVGDILGDGNFAVVKSAKDKHSETMYALKVIDVSKISGKEEMLKNEILIQRESCHPNIVQLIYDFHSPTEIFLVMELITGGDFFDLIAESIKLEEEEASLYTRDLCSGLDYLHQRNIVHRDIKPENLMVCVSSDGSTSLKIADFGLAQKVTKPIFTICGTPTYVSPEILKEEGYGLEVDVWAAGVIIYIMLCGFPPFRSPNRKQSELFDLIETGEFEFLEPYWDDVTEISKDLIRKILVIDVKERFTCNDILRHSWLTQYGFTRNNTMDVTTPTNSRFRIAAKGIQCIERMKKSVGSKLERGENFIGNITSNTS